MGVSLFARYEPRTEIIGAVLVTTDNVNAIAEDLVRRGYDVSIRCSCSEGTSLSIGIENTENSLTVRAGEYLIMQSNGLATASPDDFCKEWRKERTADA